MATIDPTKNVVVSWQDWAGPHSSETRLTVAWLDENSREMAQDIRGMHAFWMAQAFKARDAEIKQRGEQITRLTAALTTATTERDAARVEAAKAFAEGRDAALANAAMTAYDMGHPEIRKAINRLIPDDSPAIPIDDDRKRRAGTT